MRELSTGIQDFEKLRSFGGVYVDKTEYLYKMVQQHAPFFLSRPRRFGKSLFLSMLKCYWEGKRELFDGLRIVELTEGETHAWEQHPVFYFDFNKDSYQTKNALESVLAEHLEKWERQYEIPWRGDEVNREAVGNMSGHGQRADDEIREDSEESVLARRFRRILEAAVEQTERQAVVLVDEYDKPLLDTMGKSELHEHNRAVYKGFFSTLKSYDRYLRFVFITGVTKFSKVSIFSDLNQLVDISMTAQYACVCGITEEELNSCFSQEISELAKAQQMTYEECALRLKHRYDGYHFCENAKGVYNPFSMLHCFSGMKFGSYWFESGTPTFLIQQLAEANFNVRRITEGDMYADAITLANYRAEAGDLIPLLYQTGYLTIKDYDEDTQTYGLCYPNEEVEYGFLKCLVPVFMNVKDNSDPLEIRSFVRDIRQADLESLRDRFTAIFARLPYPTDEKPVEQNFQNVVYIVFMLLGQAVRTEVHSAKGRADCIVETDEYVYIFEFKRDESAEAALEQIETQGYAMPYAADSRKLYKIGANFSSETRTLDGWEVLE